MCIPHFIHPLFELPMASCPYKEVNICLLTLIQTMWKFLWDKHPEPGSPDQRAYSYVILLSTIITSRMPVPVYILKNNSYLSLFNATTSPSFFVWFLFFLVWSSLLFSLISAICYCIYIIVLTFNNRMIEIWFRSRCLSCNIRVIYGKIICEI